MDAKQSNCYHPAASFLKQKQKNRSRSGLFVSKTLVKPWSIDGQKSGLAKLLTINNNLCKSLITCGAQEGTRTPTELPAST